MSIQKNLINIVKYNKFVFKTYEFCGNAGLAIMRQFVKQDPKLILITCFGGRKYDDSPKAIYEAMIKDHRFDDFRIVWAFREPETISIPRGEKVKIDTMEYYKLMFKARVWLTNSGMERGLFFNAKNVYHIQTWHGTAIKKIGTDSPGEAFGQSKETPVDLWLAQCPHDVDVFSRSMGVKNDVIKILGLPRNDELAQCTEEVQNGLKKKLGIPAEKKVILYAPTYREYTRDATNNCVMAPPIDLKIWKKKLGEGYVLLFRAHYEVVKSMNIVEDEFCKDVSNYANLNELMMASDMLLSDYSSIFFDYAILGRPMLCFTYDYDEYAEKRGVYFDIREALDDYASNEQAVIDNIMNIDYEKRVADSVRFRNKYVTAYGNASKSVLDLIIENVK